MIEEAQKMIIAGITENDLDKVRLALNLGADPNTKDSDGDPVLLGAAIKSQKEIINLLLSVGANPDVKGGNGIHILDHVFFTQHNNEIAELLISSGSGASMKDEDGNTALHMAARRLMAESCKILIERGADVNAKNEDNDTPLHLVFWRHDLMSNPFNDAQIKTIEILVESGADLHSIGGDGLSSIDLLLHYLSEATISKTPNP